MNPLNVSGAFHTKHMQSAQDELDNILHKIKILRPEQVNSDVYSNVTGRPFGEKDDVRNLLTRQLCETVRWSDVMNDVNDRFTGCRKNDARRDVNAILELGPGNQLKTMLSKVNRKLIRITKSIDLAT